MEINTTIKKIRKGHYIDTSCKFEIIKDSQVEGQNKWVVTHKNEQLLDQFFQNYDGLYHTLNEAVQYLDDFLHNNKSVN